MRLARIFLVLVLVMSAGCEFCEDDFALNKVWGEPCFQLPTHMVVGQNALRYQIGECRVGHTVEGKDGEVLCEGQVDKEPEVCDGKDNNCNGEKDERLVLHPWDFGNDCIQGGRCDGTLKICTNGLWYCDYMEGPPVPDNNCDGIDNDCDHRVDEGYGDEIVFCYTHELQATALCPPCSIGYWICEEGGVERCYGEEHPTKEVCDGIDNNCDCIIDNVEEEFTEVDILFVLDVSTSMSQEADIIADGICLFAAATEESNIYRYALVVVGDPDNGFRVAQDFSTADDLCETLVQLGLSGNHEPTLTAVKESIDLEESILDLDWLPDSKKSVIGFSDEEAQDRSCEGPQASLLPDPIIDQCKFNTLNEIEELCTAHKIDIHWFANEPYEDDNGILRPDFFTQMTERCDGKYFALVEDREYMFERIGSIFDGLCIDGSLVGG